jgi:hypothetical protein
MIFSTAHVELVQCDKIFNTEVLHHSKLHLTSVMSREVYGQ